MVIIGHEIWIAEILFGSPDPQSSYRLDMQIIICRYAQSLFCASNRLRCVRRNLVETKEI